jgi:hypothetical protein
LGELLRTIRRNWQTAYEKRESDALTLFKKTSSSPVPSSRRAALRYFFCANSLAASAAREKSKIDPAATSPLISFQRI